MCIIYVYYLCLGWAKVREINSEVSLMVTLLNLKLEYTHSEFMHFCKICFRMRGLLIFILAALTFAAYLINEKN